MADTTSDRVTDFLTDLDAVLKEATALPPAPTPEPVMAPEEVSAPAPARGWWERPDEAEDDDEAGADDELATAEAPAEPKKPWWSKRSDTETPDEDDEDPDDDEDDEEEADEVKAPKPTKKKGKGKKHKAKKGQTTPDQPGASLLHPRRGPQVIFAGTAAALGYGLHLDDMVTTLMAHSDQYALAAAGCALGAAVISLGMGWRIGALLFPSSLAMIAALEMVEPARIIGGGVALGFQAAYMILRRWTGTYGQVWPWKAVLWLAQVPAASTTLAFLLYGTN